MDISTSTFIAAVSALIAALSALVSVWNFQRERLNQKISAAKWKKEYFQDLLRWSDESLMLLSEAMHLCELDPKRMGGTKFFDLRHALRVKLSAQVDRGRWFFPNHAVEDYGQHKQEAFRGYRHAVLDALVLAYQELCKLDYMNAEKSHDRRKGLEHAKKMFATEIQKVLDPRSRDAEFRKLVGNVAEALPFGRGEAQRQASE